jgi:hypothetical protein
LTRLFVAHGSALSRDSLLQREQLKLLLAGLLFSSRVSTDADLRTRIRRLAQVLEQTTSPETVTLVDLDKASVETDEEGEPS